MLAEKTHICFEIMAVLGGILLVLCGWLLIIRAKKKQHLIKNIGYINIIVGLLTILIDGLLFLPSWR